MKRLLLILSIILICPLEGKSQDHLYGTASGDASSLIGRIQNPVDLATGTLNVSVPLYNLEYNGLQVPIGLSYRATGLKVEDIAGTTGLGWRLSAGGKITRVVKGYPDEKVRDDYTLSPKGGAKNGGFCNDWKHGSDIDIYKYMISKVKSGEDEIPPKYSRYTGYHQIDGEPDLFYFEIPGRSGMFVFNHDAEALTIPYQNIGIEWVSLTHFKLTDENGTVYIFGQSEEARESTEVTFANENIRDKKRETQTYVSTWHLESVMDIKGNAVFFDYAAGEDVGYTNSASTATFWCHYANDIFDKKIRDYKTQNKDAKIILRAPKYLMRIRSPQTFVEFEMQNNHNGYIANTKTYRRIRVKDQTSPNPAQERSVEFEYSYFLGNHAPRLDRISERVSGLNRTVYRFSYNTEVNMPPRDSYDVDHWGYYNGKQNTMQITAIPLAGEYPSEKTKNNVLLSNCTEDPYYEPGGYVWNPSIQVAGADDWTDSESAYNYDNEPDYSHLPPDYSKGADRSSSLTHTLANVLTRVTYPTGGYVEYEYELHDHREAADSKVTRKSGGLRIKTIRTCDGERVTENKYSYTIDPLSKISSGVPVSQVDSRYYFQMGLYWKGFDVGKSYLVSSKSFYNLSDVPGNHVYYGKVTVSNPDLSRTVYEYTTPADTLCSDMQAYTVSYWTSTPQYTIERRLVYGEDKTQTKYNSRFWRRGLLKRISTYDADNRLVSRTSNSYKFGPTNRKVDGYILQNLIGGEDRHFNYQLFVYQWVSEPIRLYKQTVFQGPYNPASESAYTFDTQHMVPTEITRKDAEGNTFTERRYYSFQARTQDGYPAGSPGEAMHFLKSGEIVVPTEIQVFRNGRLISGEYIEYRLDNKRPVIGRKLTARLSRPGEGAMGPYEPTFDSNGYPCHLFPDFSAACYEQYNTQGNVMKARDEYGIPVLTLYDKSGIMPIAVVENAEAAVVTSFEDSEDNACIETPYAKTGTRVYAGWYSIYAGSMPEGDYRLSYWKSTDNGRHWTIVRERVSLDGSPYLSVGGNFWIDDVRLAPADARVTSYTYAPGIGKSSEMDTNGRVTYWEYDAFGRVTAIRDAERNLVTGYEYNYAD